MWLAVAAWADQSCERAWAIFAQVVVAVDLLLPAAQMVMLQQETVFFSAETLTAV